MLQDVGVAATPDTVPFARMGFPIATSDGPDPCGPNSDYTGLIVNNVGSLVNWYVLTQKKEQTATVTERYISF
jgi:hypothetical protein